MQSFSIGQFLLHPPVQTALAAALLAGFRRRAAKRAGRQNRYRAVRLAAGAVKCVAWMLVAVELYCRLFGYFVWREYLYKHERCAGVALYDEKLRYIGTPPGVMDPVGDFDPHSDYKALLPGAVPEGFVRVLFTLEDRYAGSWRHYRGIDLIALARATVGGLLLGSERGGSTLWMQLVRSMRGLPTSDRGARRYLRKLRELAEAPVLWTYLGEHELHLWLATHVVLVQGASGSAMGTPLRGLGHAARVVFGKRPEALRLAESALLAAAFRRPVLLCPADSTRGLAQRDRRWSYLKERAAYGIRETYGPSHPEAAAALRELRSLEPPQPQVNPALYRAMHGGVRGKFRLLANPVARSVYFFRGEMLQMTAELQDAFGRHWRREASSVTLNVDAEQNLAFKRRLEAALAQWEVRLAGRLALPVASRGSGPRAQVLVVVADEAGRIVRYFQSGSEDFLYGGALHKRGARGRYVPGSEDLETASIAKALLAVVLGGRGDRPDSLYCDRARVVDGRPVRNADGGTGIEECAAPGALYRAVDAFRSSRSLPLFAALEGVEPRLLLQTLVDFGVTVPRGLDGDRLRLAAVYGTVTACPRTVHRLMAAILLGVTGRDAAAAKLPSIVRHVTRDPGMERAVVPAPPELPPLGDVARHFRDPAARQYVAQVLGAVVGPGGTLSSLQRWTPASRADVALHLGKTGTHASEQGEVFHIYAAGGLVLRGRPYTYVAFVGSPSPAAPLGRSLYGAHLAELIDVALSSL